ncbi:PREDICTED: calcium-binding and coiled-coil domain-containing protein 2 [Nestor notabilis]|uniref:calcium-binding and coiled-coil domain-containing protein 2 n=1 Tax=Nestor notabilis TaxID=176057 RepID=UPI000523AC94|nr:PREDICTED: calcium-binding and coiled-coil domain-containing protein 2 [Nestor notabilis]
MMEEISEEPPTSAVILDSCHFSQVIFNNVKKFYVPGGDITCYYTLSENVVPRGKDWVGIFRVGWKTTQEYYTFMWAPLPSVAHRDTAVKQQIQFKACYLPQDDEYYQFCYVDQDGLVRGASVPFQVRAETEEDILVVATQGEVEKVELQNQNLHKQNEKLKANCASLQKENSHLQEELRKTQQQNQNLLKELEEQKHLFQILQEKKKEADEENRQLREKNGRLLRCLSQEKEASSISVVSQAPKEGVLLFGNPYRAAGANLEAGAADIASIKKCFMSDEVLPEDTITSQYKAHVQNHLLECPFCSETFEKSSDQVLFAHMLCHVLE